MPRQPVVQPQHSFSPCRVILVSIVVVIVPISIASLKSSYPTLLPFLSADSSSHLGAEYDSIAKSIASGSGFANPFHIETGATAWMPPVLPHIMAIPYALGFQRQTLVDGFLAFQGIALFLCTFTVLVEASRLRVLREGSIVHSLFIFVHFHDLLQTTHDTSFILVLISLLWIGSIKLWYGTTSVKNAIVWGTFGGLSALVAPHVGAVWAILTAVRWWKRCTTKLLLSATVSIVLVAPWTIRNYIVMESWIPVKSNLPFELWQSQCLDEDGVLDPETLQFHPWVNDGKLRREYARVGESVFIQSKGKVARQAIMNDPANYAAKVGRRFIAAAIWYQPYHAASLPKSGWGTTVFARLIFILPLVATILIVITKPSCTPTVFSAILIWIISLTPFVLVSYYDRYAAPLVGMKSVIVLYGYAHFRSWIQHSVASIPGK